MPSRVLFDKVVDTLSGGAGGDTDTVWGRLVGRLVIWVAVGIFNILCSKPVALLADRLAHCRRHAVLSEVLELPLAYHSSKHSGLATRRATGNAEPYAPRSPSVVSIAPFSASFT